MENFLIFDGKKMFILCASLSANQWAYFFYIGLIDFNFYRFFTMGHKASSVFYNTPACKFT